MTAKTSPLDANRFALLLKDSRTIEADGLGPKVAILADGRFLKLFRRRRLLSTALWAPPWRRFEKNAGRLRHLQIAAPEVLGSISVPTLGLTGILYRPLPGETLRRRWQRLNSATRATEVARFGAFLGQLHDQGVYFRSLHLANVLRLPDGRFGLIDVADMRVAKRPLSNSARARNLKHLLRYRQDADWLTEQHREDWLAGYRHNSGDAAAARLAKALEHHRGR